ncbi:MAG: hypothetical protein KAW12_07300 [Candidatus Aminicenantes bacterium]|nr:hypothetical protein [Candidatus Aminicenantes bacterium]
MSIWDSTGHGAYSTEYTGGELVQVDENGTSLVRKLSVSNCDSTPGSYFHDMDNCRLYVHTSTGDSPRSDNYSFQGYTWLAITNRQEPGNPVDFIPQEGEPDGAARNAYYMPILAPTPISLTQAVSDFYTSAMRSQFGSLSFGDPAYWWANSQVLNFHNKKVVIKVGNVGDVYSDFQTIFIGKAGTPDFSDSGLRLSLSDIREGVLRQIPADRFDSTAYPNLNSQAENKVIPILWGIKYGIQPVKIDTATHRYKVTKTIFLSGTTYPIESITVYKDGVQIYEPGDYASDLNNGEFTLAADPGEAEITVDVHGLQCKYDFSTGTPTLQFSENTADILFFILLELNGIPVGQIHLEDFQALQLKRTQRIGIYLTQATETIEMIRLLQRSAVFHFIPTQDGKYTVKYYDRGVPADAKSIQDYNYGPGGVSMTQETKSAFQHVVLQYGKSPHEDNYQTVYSSEPETGYRYGNEETLTIVTALASREEAEALLEFYLNLVKEPAKKITAELLGVGVNIMPTEKVKFSRSVKNEKGETISIAVNEVYVILEARKDVSGKKTRIVGLLDEQVQGDILHTDTDHAENYTEYPDIVNTEHTNDHTNVPHIDHNNSTNEPHIDERENYTDHTDHDYYTESHANYTDGSLHFDNPVNKHTLYSDGPGYLQSHENVPHQDYPDTTNIPRIDWHVNGHGDHNDHGDLHMNVPHTNSEL